MCSWLWVCVCGHLQFVCEPRADMNRSAAAWDPHETHGRDTICVCVVYFCSPSDLSVEEWQNDDNRGALDIRLEERRTRNRVYLSRLLHIFHGKPHRQ